MHQTCTTFVSRLQLHLVTHEQTNTGRKISPNFEFWAFFYHHPNFRNIRIICLHLFSLPNYEKLVKQLFNGIVGSFIRQWIQETGMLWYLHPRFCFTSTSLRFADSTPHTCLLNYIQCNGPASQPTNQQ